MGFDKNTRFTRKQLNAIRKVSMARIICDNTEGLDEIQPNVFVQANTDTNKVVTCQNTEKIPKLDIVPFRGTGARKTQKVWIE